MMDEVLKRKMFSAPASGGVQTTPEQEAQMESFIGEIAGGLQETNKEIDDAEDYVGIMNAIRGDKQSIEQRRSELASYIGKEDANATPESALTLVQPTFSMIEASEQGPKEGGPIVEQGIVSALGDLGSAGAMGGVGSMQAPRQGEAIARMAMGEKPVMRQDGTPQTAAGGENISGPINLETIRTLQGLVPEPTTYAQNLKYYQDVLGSDKTGFELNPYISGLNLAAAVANAPQGGLISSILAPETIKAVSDPILQMAQAKSKTDQAVKLKAAEATAESKAAATKAESDLLLKLAPELAKTPDLKTFGNTEIGFYAVDPRKPQTIITLKAGLGRENKPFGDSVLGYHILNADGETTTQLQEGTGKPPKIFGDKEVGFYYLDGSNQLQTAKEGLGRPDQIFGNATTGYFTYDGKTNTATKIEGAEGTGAEPPEFIQLMDRFNEASAIVNNQASTSADVVKAKQEMIFLSDKLTTADPEFTSLMNQKADMIYKNTQGTEAQKAAARDLYIGRAIDDFIKGKTSVAQNYNPNEALDKEFAGLFGTQVKGIQEGAQNARTLADLSTTAVNAANGFTPGSFAETRLSILKMTKALGGEDMLRSLMGEERYSAFFDATGNDIPSGELLKSVGARFAVVMAESFPGNLNQSEVDLIKEAGSNLGVSKGGLKVLEQAFRIASDRAKEEAQYVVDFLADDANKGIGAEEKYARFNAGLQEIRSTSPVITEEQIAAAQEQDQAGEQGTGSDLTVIDSSGERGFIPADQVAGYQAVQDAPDRDTFIAGFADLQATNPVFRNQEAGAVYDRFISLRRVVD